MPTREQRSLNEEQLSVLAAVAFLNGGTVMELVRELRMIEENVSKRLKSLEARGFVERIVQRSEKRNIIVYLWLITDKGRDYLNSAIA